MGQRQQPSLPQTCLDARIPRMGKGLDYQQLFPQHAYKNVVGKHVLVTKTNTVASVSENLWPKLKIVSVKVYIQMLQRGCRHADHLSVPVQEIQQTQKFAYWQRRWASSMSLVV